jgi:hypothetical protein
MEPDISSVAVNKSTEISSSKVKLQERESELKIHVVPM